MFLHLSVILFGGGGLCPRMQWAGCVWPGCVCDGGIDQGGVTLRSTSGQYASYWNAFLYEIAKKAG